MEREIELKLLAPSNAGDTIERDFLPCLSGSWTTETVELSNYYFDTPKRMLREHDIGLRIRGNGKKFEQTLKTAGKSISGLQQRPEFNVPLPAPRDKQPLLPNLALFDASAWPSSFDVEYAQQHIATLFITHFTRTSYLLELRPDCQVEMVWDRGHVSAKGQSQVICEIELELKKGEVTDLFDLAKLLLSFMYLTLGNDSKASRGYRLADLLPVTEPRLSLIKPNSQSGLSASECLQSVEQALTYMQFALTKLDTCYSHLIGGKLLQCLVELECLLDVYSKLSNDSEVTRVCRVLTNLKHEWSAMVTKVKDLPLSQVPRQQVANVLFNSQVTQLQLELMQLLLDTDFD
jgi:triphosphatase